MVHLIKGSVFLDNFLWCFNHNYFGILMGKQYSVIIERDIDGFLVADVPELEGCHTQAKSMDELIKRVKEVIALCEQDVNPSKNKFVGVKMG